MTTRKALAWRLVAFAGVVLGTVLIEQSCMRRVSGPESALNVAPVGAVQSVVSVFRRVIGRDPGPSEINALKDLGYDALVKAVLASSQFDQEGFFNLHRERLLLNREGTPSWVKNSYNDYCALKLELAEEAAADRGSAGYWDVLRYRERWLPLGDFTVNACFFGTDVATILAAYAEQSAQTLNPGEATPRRTAATTCLRDLPFAMPTTGDENPEEKFKALISSLKTLSPDQQKLSLLAVPPGEALFLTLVQRNVFPDYLQLPEGTPQAKDLALELVKKEGSPVLLQEFGQAASQQCKFTPLDPVAYLPPGFSAGSGSGESTSTSTSVDVPPPLAFPEPLGIPTDPLVVAAGTETGVNLADQPAIAADGAVFIKVKMPPTLVGVHASPYWLSRHPSKARNRDLHRARVTYFSYFCADINPDAANFSGAPITEFPDNLKPYFAADDSHVKGSQNCYNCHTKVQPLANFFGLLSWGTGYDTENGDSFFNGWPQYLSLADGFDRPGGIYDGANFLAVDGTNKGLEGLANVLTKYPQVPKCLADSAWATLVGRDFPLWEEERAAAVQAFQKGVEPASLSRLVHHLMTENARGKTYFTKGEAAMAKLKPSTEFQCPDSLTEEVSSSALTTASKVCVACHQGEFIDNDKKFNFDFYFSEGNDDNTPEARGNLWQKLYCKIKLEKMPPAGAGVSLDKDTRGALWCFFAKNRDAQADTGKIPAAFKGKACPGTPGLQQTPLGDPHAIGGSDPQPGGG